MVAWISLLLVVLGACLLAEAKEFRGRGRVAPVSHTMTSATIKAAVKEKLANYDAPVQKRTLIVYHVGYLSLDYSTDVIINNMKIFRNAVLLHIDASIVEGLYIFNILGGEANPFYKYVPCDSINVMCVHLEHETMDYDQVIDFETHKDIVDLLGEEVITKFNSVMFLTYEARGPFDKQNNGEWIRSFTQMLDQPHPKQRTEQTTQPAHSNHEQVQVPAEYRSTSTLPIGAVTTGMSCDSTPRMLTHAFALSSRLVHKTFAFVGSYVTDESHLHNRTDQLASAVTMHLLEQGVNVASLVQQARLAAPLRLNSEVHDAHNPLTELPVEAPAESELPDLTPDLVNGRHLRAAATDTTDTTDTTYNNAVGHANRKLKGKKVVLPLSPEQLNHAVGYAVYDNSCLLAQGTLGATTNPVLWCNLQPTEILFMRYGGSVLRHPGILCEEVNKVFSDATINLNAQYNMKLTLPETLYGGPYKDLYKQYAHEDWQWHHSSVPKLHSSDHSSAVAKPHSSGKKGKKSAPAPPVEPLVCFLVRSASVHSVKVNTSEPPSRLVKMDIDLLILTLVKQVNPHWKAFFFVTDEKPFEQELQAILGKYNDNRLSFLNVPGAYRPAFTTIDAGYTATDYALTQMLSRPECRYISLSNADNAYGSHVVENVLHARNDRMHDARPNMILAPLDSRNFAEQDFVMRTALRGGKTGGWRERCVGVETSLRVHNFVYTIQTVPLVGRVDLAAVFLDVAKLKNEHLFFSNFSDVSKYSCKGCQDGYLTEALVSQRHWSYLQLPIDGLKSMVFHGPSPTLCIASGNVWFDFPEVNKLGCVSHRTIGHLQPPILYDLNRFFDAKSHRVCLRVSQKGYWNRTGSIIT